MKTLKKLFVFTVILITFQTVNAQNWGKVYNGTNPFKNIDLKNYQGRGILSDSDYVYVYFYTYDTLEVYQSNGNGNWTKLPELWIDSSMAWLPRPSLFGLYQSQLFVITGQWPGRASLTKWDGTKWVKIINENQFVNFNSIYPIYGVYTGMLTYNNELYIYGRWDSINGISSKNNTVKYDGTKFSDIDSNLRSSAETGWFPFALTIGDKLYGRDTSFVAKQYHIWDGKQVKHIATPDTNTAQWNTFINYHDTLHIVNILRTDYTTLKLNGSKWDTAWKSGTTDIFSVPTRFVVYKDQLWGAAFPGDGNKIKSTFAISSADGWITNTTELSKPFNIKIFIGLLIVFKDELYIFGDLDSNKTNDSINIIAKFNGVYQTLSGKVYYDNDSNCSYNNADYNLKNRMVELNPGGYLTNTDANGNYKYIVGPGNHHISLVPNRNSINSLCSEGGYTVAVIDSSGKNSYDSLDFPLLVLPTPDLSINIMGYTGFRVRRGFTEHFKITVTNYGYNKQKPVVTLKSNKILQNINSDRTPVVLNDTTAIWELDSLLPGNIASITFSKKIDTAHFRNGDNLKLYISVNPMANDSYVSDNYDTLTQQVRASFDPNSKSVYPVGNTDNINIIRPGINKLEYCIHFENNGNDTAYKVVIYDTIDVRMELKDIRETGFSHKCKTSIRPIPQAYGKGLLVWTFDNIKLPPKNKLVKDDVANQGFISYSISLKNNLPIKTEVGNKAYIYFDYNFPVITNTALVRIDTAEIIFDKDSITSPQDTTNLGIINEKNISELMLFPNPASDLVNITYNGNEKASYIMTNMQGQTIYNGILKSEQNNALSISYLPEGIYFIRINCGEKMYNVKVVKQ